VLIGIAATAGAYAAAVAALPALWHLLWKQTVIDHTGSLLWYGYNQGSLVFLCCLFGGLILAAILTFTRTARADIAIATVVGSVGGWSLQAYGIAFKGVSEDPFGGHASGIDPFHSPAGRDYILYVTGAFILVGVCQALTIRRSAALAVFWPAVWLAGGLAFAVALSNWDAGFRTTNQDLILFGSGALLGLLASVWAFVPLGIRLPIPSALPAPIASAVGGITLVAAGVGGAYLASGILSGPIDDPRYFCGAPDPSPAPGISASMVLQECATGKTFTLHRGQTVAIDLPGGGHGVDTSTGWSDFNVSDTSVLSEVTPRVTLGGKFGQEEIALYRALGSGEATISRVLKHCTANGGGFCDRGYRWSVTIHVA
jgi:hypothetical protein